MLKNLRHENIIEFIDEGRFRGQYSIVFEYLHSDLNNFIEREGKMNPALAVQIFRDIIKGVEALHVSNFFNIF